MGLPALDEWLELPLLHCIKGCGSQHGISGHHFNAVNISGFRNHCLDNDTTFEFFCFRRFWIYRLDDLYGLKLGRVPRGCRQGLEQQLPPSFDSAGCPDAAELEA